MAFTEQAVLFISVSVHALLQSASKCVVWHATNAMLMKPSKCASHGVCTELHQLFQPSCASVVVKRQDSL